MALLTLTHAVILAFTIGNLAPLLLPTTSFMPSALCALVVGAAFAFSFSATDRILSSLLEKPVLCVLTFNEQADRTGIIVWVFACFALGYISVAALGLWLCNILSIFALRSAFDFIATTALLVAVQTLLIIHRYVRQRSNQQEN
jgi:apolipoprotein N-acyltransferase